MTGLVLCRHQTFYIGRHFVFVVFNALQQFELGQRPLPVVFGMFYLVVVVAVEVVRQETHRLHIGEQFGPERQVFGLDGKQERLGAFYIPFGIRFENLHVQVYIVQILVIFGPGVPGSPDEITEV